MMTPSLPGPRGPLSTFLREHLLAPVHELPAPPAPGDGAVDGDDFHLSLYLCYELHYRGFCGIDAAWEWEPSLLTLRRELEDAFVAATLAEVGTPSPDLDLTAALQSIVDSGNGPSLSAYMAERGSLEEFREFAVHRSAYQLKEADPHTWAIPRLTGATKAALVEIQADEYGGGRAPGMHSMLFAQTLAALGLDGRYGAYLDAIPGVTLATVNLVSLFGLHRRWRGALVGHLAIFEMASVGPNSRYGDALRRLGLRSDATRFYDVHVAADAVHEVVASRLLAGGLAADEPELVTDIVFGAKAIMATEARFARHLLDAWSAGRTSLLRPLGPTGPRRGEPGRGVSLVA